jgi:hypothetical protein
MLKPNKYTDVSLSVFGVSAGIISQLRKEPVQKYNQLLSKTTYSLGENAKVNFSLAILFLFTTGKIRYYRKDDAIELLRGDEQK